MYSAVEQTLILLVSAFCFPRNSELLQLAVTDGLSVNMVIQAVGFIKMCLGFFSLKDLILFCGISLLICITVIPSKFLVPVWSGVNVAGVALREVKPDIGKSADSDKWQDEVHKGVVSAHVLISLLTFTFFLFQVLEYFVLI